MLDLPRDGRLLIVDDSELYCYLTALACNQAGLTSCETCTTVKDALAALDRFKPDACLLDVCLGLDFSYDIASSLSERNIPFALCSGDEPPIKFSQFSSLCGYLRKPSPVSQMIDTVRDLFEKRHAGSLGFCA